MNYFGLANTAFWWAMGLVTVAAIGLHFLRVRAPQRLVPTLEFWLLAAPKDAPRLLWHRLSRLGTLLLILAVLYGLLFSAREVNQVEKECSHRVLLLDPVVLALPEVRKEVEQMLAEMLDHAAGCRRALVLAGTPPRVFTLFSDPPGAPLTALRQLANSLDQVNAKPADTEPLVVPPDWSAALAQAKAMLTGCNQPGVEVFYLDPARLPTKQYLDKYGIPVWGRALPAPIHDDGIVAAGPVYTPDGLARVMVQASRRGHGGRDRELVVQAGKQVKRVQLSAQNPAVSILLDGLSPGTRVHAVLQGKDQIQYNNVLEFTLPLPTQVKVYAPEVGPVMRAVLTAVPRVQVIGSPDQADLQVRCGETSLDQGLPALVFRSAENSKISQGEIIPASDQPLVADLVFSGVCFGRLAPGGICLARLAGRPVINLQVGRQLVIKVAADPDDPKSGLADSPDFPRFVARALPALGGKVKLEAGAQVNTWVSFTCRLDQTGLAGGGNTLYPAVGGQGEFLAHNGEFSFASGGLPIAAPPGEEAPLESPTVVGSSPWPGILLLLILLLAAIEWWAYHRGRVA